MVYSIMYLMCSKNFNFQAILAMYYGHYYCIEFIVFKLSIGLMLKLY